MRTNFVTYDLGVVQTAITSLGKKGANDHDKHRGGRHRHYACLNE
jgi:hypothetical protein